MARTYNAITEQLRAFIEAQQMFFVASAPLSAEGHVNMSPKGLDSPVFSDPIGWRISI